MTTPTLIEAARELCAEAEEYECADGIMLAAPIDLWHALMDAIEAAEGAQPEPAHPEAEITFLRRVADARQQIIDGMIAERCAKQDAEMPRPLADWHEDDGAVVWWRFLVDEPAWIGTPLDDDWPGYHTHWTPHPKLPERER